MALTKILANVKTSVRPVVNGNPANTDTTLIANLDVPGDVNGLTSASIDYSSLTADEKKIVNDFVTLVKSKQ